MSEVEEIKLNKLNIVFSDQESEEFKFQGNIIIVIPYIFIGEKIGLIREYINNLFDEFEYDLAKRYMVAEYALILQLIEGQTNVETDKLDVDKLISSKLWEQIKSRLLNYDEFREELNRVLELRQAQESLNKSVGTILEQVSVKAIDLLNKISEMDVENFKDVSAEFSKQLEVLNENLPGITKKASVSTPKRKYTKKS